MPRQLPAILSALTVLVGFYFGTAHFAQAQTRAKQGAMQGISLRFATSLNHFFRADEHPLINGSWSTGILGVSYKQYKRNGHAEFGVAFGYKGQGSGLPLVMQDFNKNGNGVAQTFLQGELKAGPRLFWHFYPKFGVIAGYRFRQEGYYETDAKPADLKPLNAFYMSLPMGFTIDLPTSFGTTGFGFFYELGLTDTMRGLGWTDGSHTNGLTFEIHATIRTK